MPDNNLTEFDYEFLKGNEKFWDVKGAAYNAVHSWCAGKEYGTYGKPTESGKTAMRAYEENSYPKWIEEADNAGF